MRKVELRMNELKKYKIIKELVDHGGNKKRVSIKLGLSIRQVNRLIHIYKEKGKSGFVHGNRNKKPVTALDKQISDNILLLYTLNIKTLILVILKIIWRRKKIYMFPIKLFTTFWLNKVFYLLKQRKRTRKEFKKQQLLQEKKINLAMDQEQIDIVVNHELSLEDSHPR